MLSYPDLFAYDAKYHRVCYSHYISELNIKSAQRKSGETVAKTLYDDAFDELNIHLNRTVFSKQKTVTTLASLRSQFVNSLVELGVSIINAEKYTTWKLKDRLTKHYGDELVSVTFDGRTDIVCSSSVTLGDALKKASLLQDTSEETQYEDLPSAVPPTPSDEMHILHTAAGILRKLMTGTTYTADVYAPADHTNVQQ